MATPQTAAALAEAKALVAALEAHDGTPQSNTALIRRTNVIRGHLENPYDKAIGWFQSGAACAGMYIVFRLGILEKLPNPGTTPGISATTLAEQTNAHLSLITRVMRLLVLDGICVETGPDEYAHNEMSLASLQGGIAAMTTIANEFMKSWLHLPDYVRAHQPADMQDLKKSPYASVMLQEGETYYQVLEKDPKERDMWNHTLAGMEAGFPILGMFDFKAATEEGKKDPERPFIVDVGGGRGQALLAIKGDVGESMDGLKLVLQDLPVVLDTLKQEEVPGVELVPYDIFTPQLVKSKSMFDKLVVPCSSGRYRYWIVLTFPFA